MERVREFDNQLRTIYSTNFLMSKVLIVIFTFIGQCMFIIPYSEIHEEFPLMLISCMELVWSCYFMLQPYMVIRDKGERFVPICKKLKYLPMARQDIWRVRVRYLNCFCVKQMAASIVLQFIGAVLCHTYAVWIVLYPMASWGFVWLFNFFYICTNIFRN